MRVPCVNTRSLDGCGVQVLATLSGSSRNEIIRAGAGAGLLQRRSENGQDDAPTIGGTEPIANSAELVRLTLNSNDFQDFVDYEGLPLVSAD